MPPFHPSPSRLLFLSLAATVLLAQGAGRLVRNESDRGIVAVLDRRLTAMRYGQRILRSLPRLLRTADRQRAVRFLQGVATERAKDSA